LEAKVFSYEYIILKKKKKKKKKKKRGEMSDCEGGGARGALEFEIGVEGRLRARVA
jgi:hypothetical protein